MSERGLSVLNLGYWRLLLIENEAASKMLLTAPVAKPTILFLSTRIISTPCHIDASKYLERFVQLIGPPNLKLTYQGDKTGVPDLLKGIEELQQWLEVNGQGGNTLFELVIHSCDSFLGYTASGIARCVNFGIMVVRRKLEAQPVNNIRELDKS